MKGTPAQASGLANTVPEEEGCPTGWATFWGPFLPACRHFNAFVTFLAGCR
jgi:hypothetical protein